MQWLVVDPDMTYQNPVFQRYQAEMLKAWAELENKLPITTANDILRGVLLGLARIMIRSLEEPESEDINNLYGTMIFYGLASFTVRNHGGRYVEIVDILDQVCRRLDPQWDTKKEEAKSITRRFAEIADFLEEQEQMEFFYAVSIAYATGMTSAFYQTSMSPDIVLPLFAIIGAASGLSLGVLHDLTVHAGRIQNLLMTVSR